MKAENNGDLILLSHGGGGQLTRELIGDVFLRAFDNSVLRELDDSGSVDISGIALSMTTDSFVVRPLFFPGGDIGHLAVCGTVNDLAVSGAMPVAITAGFIIEEGFSRETLKKIVNSMARTAKEAGVPLVAGDTKVVERGAADGVFINTAGVGIRKPGLMSPDPLTEGDVLIINGPVGDHGIAVLSARENLPVESPVRSDAACLHRLIFSVLEAFPGQVKFMRDATRGGLSALLNEMAESGRIGVEADEDAIPVNPAVLGVCGLLGMDPLNMANEGKVVMAVKKEKAREIADFLKKDPLGAGAAVIGRITERKDCRVTLKTTIGARRILDMPLGDDLPRIC